MVDTTIGNGVARASSSRSRLLDRSMRAVIGQGLRCGFALASRLAPPLATRWALTLFTTPQRRIADDWRKMHVPQQWLIDTARGRLSCYRWTPALSQTGRRVLLVHGWSGSVRQFAPLIEALLVRGFEVIGYDQPAHGNSDGRHASLPDFVAALEALTLEIGHLDGAIGHSLGATALAQVAARCEGRIGSVVLAAAPADLVALTRRFARMLGLSERARRNMQSRVELRYGQAMDGFAVETLAGRITMPVLLAHAEADAEVPFDETQRYRRAIPHCEQLRITGAGHRTLLRQPEFVAAVVSFLLEETD